MKYSTLLAATYAAATSAAALPHLLQQLPGYRFLPDLALTPAPEQYLIDTGEVETRWVTDDEKWQLRRVRSSSVCLPTI